MDNQENIVREAVLNEFSEIGELMVMVYSQLKGFTSNEEQPDYYKILANIGNLTKNPGIKLLIVVSSNGKIDGRVVYFDDMKYYVSGGTATKEKNAAGFSLLALDPKTKGKGLGKLLTEACIQLAKDEKQNQLIIHTTEASR